ncbi:uncharacterized protein EV422DRAFT_525627 [Fimicolochytrium jonesii]|uniref:uncharacterized protein n=1 Tax=Fimicolochytrium jonesii TaxID=1396493 RepID=UPI0022FDBCC0|nr:uncharacterized protein EV422DRAFT_525627 [Fimicolochytrium jonesii]KAI8822091.1 hypothetical protein EV422DRAFT_525627 [Fimicolochytrium jonesii]
MSTSVHLQEVYQLTTHPFTVALPKRVVLESAGKPTETAVKKQEQTSTGKGGSKRPPRVVVPPGFLTAGVSEREFGDYGESSDHIAEILTVQGSGVYLYDLQKQQCLHSWSVPPGHLFTCPARFLPAAPTHSSQATDSMELDTEDADVENASKLQGNVYAVIEAGTDVQEEEEKRRVWMWKVGGGAGGLVKTDKQNRVLVAGKPDASKKFDVPIFRLSAFTCLKSSVGAHISLIHENGGITVVDRDLKALASLSPKEERTRVIWSDDMWMEGPEEDGATQRILSVVEENGALVARIHKISSLQSTVKIQLVYSAPIPPVTGEPAPAAFASQKQGTKLIVAYSDLTCKVYSLNVRARTCTETLALTLNVLGLNTGAPALLEAAAGPARISITALDEKYLAVVGTRKAGSQDVLSIWDTEYGALHIEKQLNAMPEKEHDVNSNNIRTFHIGSSISPLTGSVITLSASTVTTRRPLTFSSTVELVPFHCPPLTLASVLGRLRKPIESTPTISTVGSVMEGANVIRPLGLGMAASGVVAPPVAEEDVSAWSKELFALDELDRGYLQKLLGPIKNEPEFNVVLCAWMQKKLTELNRLKEEAEAARKEAEPVPEVVVPAKHKRGARAREERAHALANAMKKEGKSVSEAALEEPAAPAEKQPVPAYLTVPPSRALLNLFPKIELSPTVVNTLLARCLRTPKTFWPRHSIQFLLRTGCASTRCCDTLVVPSANKPATNPNTKTSIIACALERGDLSIMELAIRHVADLNEGEIVDAIKWVLSVPRDAARRKYLETWVKLKNGRKWAKEKKRAAGNVNPERAGNFEKDEGEVEEDLAEVAEDVENSVKVEPAVVPDRSEVEFSPVITQAQARFLRAIFARPRTDNFLVYALKRLDDVELAGLLEWLTSVLMTEQLPEDDEEADEHSMVIEGPSNPFVHREADKGPRIPLWWLWAPEKRYAQSEPIAEGSYEEWQMALDLLPILLTAHLPTLLHTPSLVASLTTLHAHITAQTSLLTTFNTRLRAPLLTAVQNAEEEQRARARRAAADPMDDPQKGRRWKRMVEDAQGEVYDVEVYRV